MTQLERIKYLRKELLNLTQDEFACKINISRSNFANIEKGSVKLTERVINDICRTFAMNREWLIVGTEPIFTDGNSDENIELSKLISMFQKLNKDNKKYLQGYVHRLLEEQSTSEE